ncbi:MAG TPA: NAD-dependent epimerase/dehydratase family protein [Nitrospinota bacterium]|nr:NAD-dependent epimerase/dehydratase family protein [Nitrospinota bacterium]
MDGFRRKAARRVEDTEGRNHMKALVTGGGGFLGQVIVEMLLKRGESVRVMGRSKYPLLEKQGVETFTGDIRNYEAVMAATSGMDTVFHVASMTGIWGKWKDFFETNVTGTENILKACRKNGVSKFVYTSTPSVIYGGGENFENVDETIPYPAKYNCYYPATKAIAEKKVLAENSKEGLLTVSLRPHLIWGPRDSNLIPRLIERAKSGRLIRVGDGKNLVDIVYVDNAAHAHLLAVDRLEEGSPVCGQAYFISQGKPVFLWDWIDQVLFSLKIPPVKKNISYGTAQLLGFLFETIYRLFHISGEPMMTRFLASQLAKSHFFNIEKAKKDLGYSPVVSHEDGLKQMIKYFS